MAATFCAAHPLDDACDHACCHVAVVFDDHHAAARGAYRYGNDHDRCDGAVSVVVDDAGAGVVGVVAVPAVAAGADWGERRSRAAQPVMAVLTVSCLSVMC